jgi:hypothetical protein
VDGLFEVADPTPAPELPGAEQVALDITAPRATRLDDAITAWREKFTNADRRALVAARQDVIMAARARETREHTIDWLGATAPHLVGVACSCGQRTDALTLVDLVAARVVAHRGRAPSCDRATERDLLRSLPPGTYTLAELYAAVERADLTERADGHDVLKGKRTDTRWKHRVRGGLQGLKANGQARPLGDQVWHIEGTPDAPVHAVMVSLDGTRGDVELRLQRAADLLADLDEPADLVFTDPPYGCGVDAEEWDRIEHAYGRDSSRVVAGYQDVPDDEYEDFTAEWVKAAAQALRPGGHLVVVTGAERAADVQIAGRRAGLTFLNSIAAEKPFPLHTRRKFAGAHYRLTVLCRGPERNPARVFNVIPELPKAKTGRRLPA